MSTDEYDEHVRLRAVNDDLSNIEAGFVPLSPENYDQGKTALVNWADGAVRLTSTGRKWFEYACLQSGLEPGEVRTLGQLETLRRVSAELMLQQLLESEIEHWEQLAWT